MQEVLLTVSVTHSARTVGSGAGSLVTAAPQRPSHMIPQRWDGRCTRYRSAKLSASLTEGLTCISHHPTVEARDTTAMTSLRLLAVLNVLFKYACARQAARAFFLRPACA